MASTLNEDIGAFLDEAEFRRQRAMAAAAWAHRLAAFYDANPDAPVGPAALAFDSASEMVAYARSLDSDWYVQSFGSDVVRLTLGGVPRETGPVLECPVSLVIQDWRQANGLWKENAD